MGRSLVIGGTGFIGMHLCRRLVALGEAVHVMVRGDGPIAGLPPEVTVHRGDLDDAASLGACLGAVTADQIFYLASNTRKAMARTAASAQLSLANLTMLVNFIEALCSVPTPPKVVVRAGSIAEYGHIPVPYREADREMPVNPYGTSMLAGTHYLSTLAPVLPCPVPTARLALVYGPGQPASYFVAAQVAACLARRPMPVSHPLDRRDLIFVEDAVDGLIALAANPPPGAPVLNIATGIAPQIGEVAARIAVAAGLDPATIPTDWSLAHEPPSILLSDPVRARDWLGWQASTRWEDGIERTVAAARIRRPALRVTA